jgi:hypothetical protein
MPDVGLDASVDDQYVALFAAGTPATGEFHCSECGYGVAIHAELPRCPMCGGGSWEELVSSPSARPLESP